MTGVSVAYNLCVGVLGGMTPMVAAYLIRRTHDDLSPAFYLMGAAAVTLAAAAVTPETSGQALGPVPAVELVPVADRHPG